MSDILFRGKPDWDNIDEDEVKHYAGESFKGGFVYGQVVYNKHDVWIVGPVEDACEEYIAPQFWIPVIPETVGQKSGLKECPGTKDIWQRDVVRITLISSINGKPIVIENHVVELRNGMFGVEWGKDDHFVPLAQFAPGTRIEVVGTVHDNPELLEV